MLALSIVQCQRYELRSHAASAYWNHNVLPRSKVISDWGSTSIRRQCYVVEEVPRALVEYPQMRLTCGGSEFKCVGELKILEIWRNPGRLPKLSRRFPVISRRFPVTRQRLP